MDAKEKRTPSNHPDFHLAFDVGHSSIGWAVLKRHDAEHFDRSIDIIGCGVVTFRADDCLASNRRAYRRQRRHIRSTRQRIKRLKALLAHLSVLSPEELDRPGCAWPWQLAARVLSSKSGQNPALLLSWPELWDVLRWYAHNRGYDGNRRWSATGIDSNAEREDTEKVENAQTLMHKHGAQTMAETVCAICGIDPLGSKKSSNPAPEHRFKGQNAAFPRDIVEREVQRILEVHVGKLKGLTQEVVRALVGNGSGAWKDVSCPAIKLPNRFHGSLLFGQLVPRFDNRIISKCPISGDKVPTRDCPEFLNFRWAMQLANIRVATATDRDLRTLTVEERKQVDKAIRERGYLTPTELKQAVRTATGCTRDNLENMLMHPDAKEVLLVDPVQKVIMSDELSAFWNMLPERLQKRFRGQLRRHKPVKLADIRNSLIESGMATEPFDSELQRQLDAANTKRRKRDKQTNRDELLRKSFAVAKLSGRAPFARQLLVQAVGDVMAGTHPKEEGGCLYLSESIRTAQMNRRIEQQTNNHLIRHRLLILERLIKDVIDEYADGDKGRVAIVTIEVNRDLRELSGKTAKEKAMHLESRVANHHAVAAKLEKAFAGQTFNGKPIQITAGLIRKARIAEDLGWRCPYTGQTYEPIDLVTRRVDKDHIVPRSQRAADGLDSQVITFSQVNGMKGKRTARQFIAEEQGKPVRDLPNLSILALKRFTEFVDSLESFKGHEDDKRRKKKRKDLLRVERYEEKEFVPRDLTQTSQLVRMGAQLVRKVFQDCREQPVIVSLPGSVTGTVRKSWNVLGCLSLACPQVLDETGAVRTKTDIRDITHLHHALDACVLGLASHFIPNNGRVWELIIKRKLSDAEKRQLLVLGVFGFDTDNRFQLRDLSDQLKKQIRERLAERRAVQHLPSRMGSLRAEQNTWRVIAVKDGQATIQQSMRAPNGSRVLKKATEKIGKLLGLDPEGSGKLRAIKGALVIPDNYGLAILDHAASTEDRVVIVPHHKVWHRLNDLRIRNRGHWPRVLRPGSLVRLRNTKPAGKRDGIWRVYTAQASLKIDLVWADSVERKKKGTDVWREVSIANLGLHNIEVLPRRLSGFPQHGSVRCPTISSA